MLCHGLRGGEGHICIVLYSAKRQDTLMAKSMASGVRIPALILITSMVLDRLISLHLSLLICKVELDSVPRLPMYCN